MGASAKPVVAIVGRPNVGKSTLFNRLVSSRLAITDNAAGTTRDRLYADGEWQGTRITYVDTAGYTDDQPEIPELTSKVNQDIKQAVEDADVVMMVVDAQAGKTAEDEAMAHLVRRHGSQTVLVANKVDNVQAGALASEFFSLGLGEPHPVSAIHGRGTGDLLDLVVQTSPEPRAEETETTMPRVALIGRPNVGKSTLFNTLAGRQERLSSATPHTTRDIGKTLVDTPDGPMELLDTAGVMRRGKSGRGLAKYSFLRSLRAINEADVCCLLIDAVEGPTLQDAHIAAYIQEAGKAIVLVVNKWDLVEKTPDIQDTFYDQLGERLGFLPSPPIVFLSALTGGNKAQASRAVYDVWKIAGTEIETAELNQTLRSALPRLPAGKGRHSPKLYYATQVGTRPPAFMLFVNKAEAWSENHRRYLINVLREQYGLLGTPIVLRFRSKPPREKAIS